MRIPSRLQGDIGQLSAMSWLVDHGAAVLIATRGGNQSRSGLVKRFDPRRCDYLFIHVGDGRRWFIPSEAVEGGTGLLLGGPKYEAYEVEPGRTLEGLAEARIATLADARRGTRAVKGTRL